MRNSCFDSLSVPAHARKRSSVLNQWSHWSVWSVRKLSENMIKPNFDAEYAHICCEGSLEITGQQTDINYFWQPVFESWAYHSLLDCFLKHGPTLSMKMLFDQQAQNPCHGALEYQSAETTKKIPTDVHVSCNNKKIIFHSVKV
jgi:hypothetical protein